jgi:hypothetical protein
MLVDQCAWGDNARYSPCILRFAFSLGRYIVEKLVTDCNVLVQILDKGFQIAIELVRGKASLLEVSLLLCLRWRKPHHRHCRFLATFDCFPLRPPQIEKWSKLVGVFKIELVQSANIHLESRTHTS